MEPTTSGMEPDTATQTVTTASPHMKNVCGGDWHRGGPALRVLGKQRQDGMGYGLVSHRHPVEQKRLCLQLTSRPAQRWSYRS
jgi:hypothetical protein